MPYSYKDFFNRNIGLLTKKEQDILKKSRVAVAGAGGVGGIQIETLARTGVGGFNIADPEKYEASDMNRQSGADINTLGQYKAEVMANKVRAINPGADIRIYQDGVNKENLDDFLDGANVVVDSIEYFALDKKVFMHRKAKEKGLYVVTSPIPWFGASMFVFDPKGMNLEEYLELEGKSPEELKSVMYDGYCLVEPGYIPNPYPEAIKGRVPIPSLSVCTTLSGAMVANEVLMLLLSKRKPNVVPMGVQLDLWTQKYYVVDTSRQKTKWRKLWDEFAVSGAYEALQEMDDTYGDLHTRVRHKLADSNWILDVGCGTGYLSREMAKRGKQVWGIDSSFGMLAVADMEISKLPPEVVGRIHLDKQYVDDIKYPNETFDAVAAINVIFQMDDPGSIMSEVNRVLKPGGTFVLSGPISELDINVMDDEQDMLSGISPENMEVL